MARKSSLRLSAAEQTAKPLDFHLAAATRVCYCTWKTLGTAFGLFWLQEYEDCTELINSKLEECQQLDGYLHYMQALISRQKGREKFWMPSSSGQHVWELLTKSTDTKTLGNVREHTSKAEQASCPPTGRIPSRPPYL